MQNERTPGKKALLLPVLLVILTAIAYSPALKNGYIWDDDYYVTNNPNLHTVNGLRSIWFDPHSTPQYYPLTHTTFWIEYQLWGLRPSGYHLVNILLHAVNAILLWQVLKALQVPGAALAGFLFALHPVHVESVAWITERKNVLSLLFYLLAFRAYLRFSPLNGERGGRRPDWRYYAIALVLFLCALLGKTVTCTLPAAILLVTWWKNARLCWRDIAYSMPMFLLGLALSLPTIWLEKNHVGARGIDWSLNFIERSLIAGRALWFYAGKLIWPVNLAFIYPRWVIDAGSWRQYLYPGTAIAVVVLLFILRHWIGRGPLTAVLFFVGSLFPALGFFDVYPMLYSFVADHFQYLASIGLITAFASAATLLYERFFGKTGALARQMTAGIPLLILGVISFKQSYAYRDPETLWRDTLSKNPDCWMAYDNLGVVCTRQGKLDEAIAYHRQALRLRPNDADILHDLGTALLRQGKLVEAEEHFRKALGLQPIFYEAHYNLGIALFLQRKYQEAVEQLISAMQLKDDNPELHSTLAQALSNIDRPEEAARHFRQALLLKPDWPATENDLAWLLATSDDPKVRDGPEAVRLARQACEASGNRDVNYLDTLAAACAEAGDFPEAVRIGQVVLDLARSASDSNSLLNDYQMRLEGYLKSRPYREIKSSSTR